MSVVVRSLLLLSVCLLAVVGTRAAEPVVAGGEVKIEKITRKALEELVAQHKGKVVLIDFWATYCVPCIKELPHSVALQKQFGDQGLVVLTMAMEDADNTESVLAILKKAGATTTKNLLDAEGGSGESFTAFEIDNGALPHYRLYGRDGKLFKKFTSGDPDGNDYKVAEIDAAIETLLKK